MSPTYSMTKYTLDSDCKTLGKFFGTLDCSLVRFVEEILDACSQTTNDTERIAKDVQTKYQDVHLLQSLTIKKLYAIKLQIHAKKLQRHAMLTIHTF